jgi:hypothetical protein
MGMFPSPFPPIAASPSRDGRDLQRGHREASHRRKGAGARSVADTTHPRALLVRWTRLPGAAEPARSTRCDPSRRSMVGLISAGPRTHVGDAVYNTPPLTRQPVAPRAPDRVCRAARGAEGDLPLGQCCFRRSAARGLVPSRFNPGIATHRRARVDRARNPLRQHQRPSDEPPTVPVATAWADFASSRRIGPTEPDTAFNGPVQAAVRREGELADHAVVDRCSTTDTALRPRIVWAGRSDGAGGRRRRVARSLNRRRG